MKTAVILMLGLALTPLYAAPFAKGDPKAGKALHDKSCMTCHDNGMYTRANRIIKTPAQLAARVAACNANTGASWFPDEEQHVNAYLNQSFYHFK
jgi:cytochrome c553